MFLLHKWAPGQRAREKITIGDPGRWAADGQSISRVMARPGHGGGSLGHQLCQGHNGDGGPGKLLVLQGHRTTGHRDGLWLCPTGIFKIRASVRLLHRAQRKPEPRVYGLARQRAREGAAPALLHWQPAIRASAQLAHGAERHLEARINGLTRQRVWKSAALALLNPQQGAGQQGTEMGFGFAPPVFFKIRALVSGSMANPTTGTEISGFGLAQPATGCGTTGHGDGLRLRPTGIFKIRALVRLLRWAQ
jgi:hypothetical protein